MIYIVQYKQQSTVIEKHKISLHHETEHIDFSNVIFFPSIIGNGHPISDFINKSTYASILSFPWIVPDLWGPNPYFRNFLNHKVYLFIEKRPDFEYLHSDKNLIFENTWYVIIDTGMKIKDALNADQTVMNFAAFASLILTEPNAAKKAHNISVGLPADFDPARYLELNPGIQDYWKASGINESGQQLLNHAEEHYIGFGAKDNWKYK